MRKILLKKNFSHTKFHSVEEPAPTTCLTSSYPLKTIIMKLQLLIIVLVKESVIQDLFLECQLCLSKQVRAAPPGPKLRASVSGRQPTIQDALFALLGPSVSQP